MTEESLTRELERRAAGVEASPLTFEAVQGRARRIRRRRRTAVAAVAAVILAAVVLPATLAGRGPGDPQPAPPVSAGLGAAVLHDGTVTLPDGGRVPLGVDNADVTQFAVLADGRVAVALSDPFAVQVHAPDGALLASYDVAANALTASADDEQVAWVGADQRVRVLVSGAERPITLPGVPMPGEATGSIDALLGARHYLGGDFSTTTEDVTTQGAGPLRTSEPLRVTDVSPDGRLWAVKYDDGADPQFGCAGLYDPAAERMVARNCDTALLAFAPDGRHLSGAKGDGGTWSSVEVFDLQLRQVGGHEADAGRAIGSWGWGDAGHLLVAEADLEPTAADGQTSWELLRVPLDGGDPDIVAGPVTGRSPELAAEFLLSE